MSNYEVVKNSYIQTQNLDATFNSLRKMGAVTHAQNVQMTRVNAPHLTPETGLHKTAIRQSGVYSGSEFLEPNIRNPLLSASNFYLPNTLVELNAWIRYFDRFHPIVGNALDMHATVPFSRFALSGISDSHVQQFYEDMSDEMDLFRRILEVSREYELIGEVFPFAHWNDEMNAFDDIAILNPDYIDVKGIKMAGSKGLRYEMVISEELHQFINSDDPLDWEILQELDPALIRAAENGLNAPLDPFNLSHLARLASPYDVRGSSIVLGCIKDLMYEEKLREAQYSIAGGIVRPREIWKLGVKGEYMPTDTDLSDLRSLLRSAEYDPNFAIISHHGLAVDFVGAERRMLPLDREYQEIEKRILTRLYTSRAMTHGEGPCLQEMDSEGNPIEVLTPRGFIPWHDVLKNEPIAGFNPESETIEFHVPKAFIHKDYDGEMIDINSRMLSLPVTANHRMWVGDRYAKNWKIVPAENLEESHRLRCNIKPQIGESAPEVVKIDGHLHHRWIEEYKEKTIEIPLDDYLRFVGYYLSEGNIDWEKRHPKECPVPYPTNITVTQSTTNKHFKVMKTGLNKLPFNVTFDGKSRFRICDRVFAEHVEKNFGDGSGNKRIDPWIKQLPAEKLEILIESLLAGDGQFGITHAEYSTISEQLARDFQEIAFRAGYTTRNSVRKRKPPRRNLHRCRISKLFTNSKLGTNPTLKGALKRRHYKGKVWCFEVPPHELFIVRSKGKIFVVGNTYSNASVAMKILDARYATKRDLIVDWVINNIFVPVALANEFYKPVKREIMGHYRVANRDRELMIPEFKWLSLVNLVEQQQQIQYALQLVQKAMMPMKVVCDLLQLDYDEVKEYLRREQGTVLDPTWQETRKQAASAAARNIGSGEDGGAGGGLFPESSREIPAGDNEDNEDKDGIEKDVADQAERDTTENTRSLDKVNEDVEKQRKLNEPSSMPQKEFGFDNKKKVMPGIFAGKEYLGRIQKDADKLLKDFLPDIIED